MKINTAYLTTYINALIQTEVVQRLSYERCPGKANFTVEGYQQKNLERFFAERHKSKPDVYGKPSRMWRRKVSGGLWQRCYYHCAADYLNFVAYDDEKELNRIEVYGHEDIIHHKRKFAPGAEPLLLYKPYMLEIIRDMREL